MYFLFTLNWGEQNKASSVKDYIQSVNLHRHPFLVISDHVYNASVCQREQEISKCCLIFSCYMFLLIKGKKSSLLWSFKVPKRKITTRGCRSPLSHENIRSELCVCVWRRRWRACLAPPTACQTAFRAQPHTAALVAMETRRWQHPPVFCALILLLPLRGAECVQL